MTTIGNKVNTFIDQTNQALASEGDGPKAARWIDPEITVEESDHKFRSAAKAILGALFAEKTDISDSELQLLRQGLGEINDVGSLASLSPQQLNELRTVVDKAQTSIHRVYLSAGEHSNAYNELERFKGVIEQSLEVAQKRETSERQVQNWNSAPSAVTLPPPGQYNR